jgi:serine/threonine protein kinase
VRRNGEYRARTALKRSRHKILPQDAIVNPEREKRFEHEAQAASALNHRIFSIYDIGTEDGTAYIVSELVRESLRKQIQRVDTIKNCSILPRKWRTVLPLLIKGTSIDLKPTTSWLQVKAV